MKTATGRVQGFNAQAAVNANQVVVACAVTREHNDVGQLLPMIAAVTANAAAGIDAGIGTVVADAGYSSEDNATAAGLDRLIATTKEYRAAPGAKGDGHHHRSSPRRGRAPWRRWSTPSHRRGAAAYG